MVVVVWIARSVELPCQLFPLLFEATFDADAAAAGAVEAVLATSAAVEAVLATTSPAVEAAAALSFSFSRFFSGGRVGQSSMRWSAALQLWQRLGMGACGHLEARWFAKSPQLKHLRVDGWGKRIKRYTDIRKKDWG